MLLNYSTFVSGENRSTKCKVMSGAFFTLHAGVVKKMSDGQ